MCVCRVSRLVLAILLLVGAVGVADEVDQWRTVFDRAEDISASDGPVVCLLNIEHPEKIRKQLANGKPDLYSGDRVRRRVATLAGAPCLHLHFTEVTGTDLEHANVKAIMISGRSKVVKPDRDHEFFALIRNTRIPIIGFCGGMQLIGKAFSSDVTRIRTLREGEGDPNPRYHPGLFKEWGFLPVKITHRDPLFESLPDAILVREAHAFHIPAAPPEFIVLAATDECPVQAFKHRQRSLYGTQFHPEAFDEKHPHGQVVLSNFFRLAGVGPTAEQSNEMDPRPQSGTTNSASLLDIPDPLKPYVKTISVDELGGVRAESHLERIDEDLYRLRLSFKLEAEAAQDDWRVTITPAFQPSFHWSPHLTPTHRHIIDQHAFRSPALIAHGSDRGLTVIPDLNIMSQGTPTRWYMDMDAPGNTLVLGMSDYDFDAAHRLLFVRKPGAVYPSGDIEFGFYLFLPTDQRDLQNPWRWPLEFMWKNWGQPLFESGHPLQGDLEPYVKHTYNWAFNTWKDSIWQEFEWNGKKVGAPVFIVNSTQSPNYPGLISEREFRSIWNQAWFSSLRSASGLYRFGRRTKNKDLLDKALLTKELALAAPMSDGLFDTVIATEMELVEIEGKQYKRSKGWGTAFWGNSNRNPVNRPAGERANRDCQIAPYHVLDMSWTALLMLRWYAELEQDTRLVDYAKTYADRLLTLQDEKGFFPAWLNKSTGRPIGVLDQSPETSMTVTFLLKLAQITGNDAYRESALRAMDAVVRDIVPVGRWEDFETYWSSSPYRAGPLIGKKIDRNNMHKQCNFSMFWTTEALFESYQVTKDREYLEQGRRVLDEMLMTQASWQPPYMYVNVLGGFGVMNCDGEWLDSRESLFAELIVRYGQELNCNEYIQRGLAALRSSFVMMYCPENPKTKLLWEKKHPFFGPADYGFTMENYAHGGRTSREGAGMGVFTIYDWGNGAAAEAYNRMLDRFGAKLVHTSKAKQID